MTEDQKEILIAKMIDVPHSLSDEDLEEIMTDDELRDIFEISSTVRGACIRQPEIDVAEEWRLFHHRIHPKPTKMRWFIRVAAIFSGILIVSGIMMKMIDYPFSTEGQLPDSKKGNTAHAENILTITRSTKSLEPQESVTIKEPTIRTKQASVSSQHHDKNKTTKQKQEPEGLITDIDIDEYLRIQQARIDNDLAVQVAEAYMEEYYHLLPILDASGTNNPYIDNLIRKTTMQ